MDKLPSSGFLLSNAKSKALGRCVLLARTRNAGPSCAPLLPAGWLVGWLVGWRLEKTIQPRVDFVLAQQGLWGWL